MTNKGKKTPAVVATTAQSIPAVVNDGPGFIRTVNRIARLDLVVAEQTAKMEKEIEEVRAQYRGLEARRKKRSALAAACERWFFSDAENQSAVLSPGTKSGESDVARWKVTTGAPGVTPKGDKDEAITLLERTAEGRRGLRVIKNLALAVLRTWAPETLEKYGLERTAATKALKIDPK